MKKRVLVCSVIICVVSIFTLLKMVSVKAYDEYKEPYINDNDVYEVICAGELKWLADNINNRNIYQKDIKLMNDINLSGYEWTPIGMDMVTDFEKTFDGNNKKITGLTYNYSAENNSINPSEFDAIGLFGYSTGVIKDVYVSGTIKSNIDVGGICGVNDGIIQNCISNINVITKGNGAGVCCVNKKNIFNVGNEGFIVGKYAAGICSDNYSLSAIIENAYNIGDIETTDKMGARGAGIACKSSGKIRSVYSVGELTTHFHGSIEQLAFDRVENGYEDVSEECLQSGELTYKLNSNKSGDDVVWRQILGEDEYPVFYGSVVYCGYNGCEKTGYTNEEVDDTPTHNFSTEYSADENCHYHKCNNCDEVIDVEEHVYTDGSTYKNETHHTRLCTICGYNVDLEHVWQEPYVEESSEEGKADVTVFNCADCGCKKTVEILIDEELPSGTLKMETTFFSGLFCGNKKTVTIDAFDEQSGVRCVEYTLQENSVVDFNILEWLLYKKGFKVNMKTYPFIYVRITDNCGNYVIIDKDSKVVYTGAYDEPKTYNGTIHIEP